MGKRIRKIMIVAGETSGDNHAAKLVKALIDSEPETDFQFFGAAGPKMRDAGVDAVVDSDGLSIVGLAEIGRALPMFLRASNDLKKAAKLRGPDVVVLVDFPDFNLKLAKHLKTNGFTVVYYISPQLWAWRKYRIAAVRKYVDLMLTILPFEKAWYAKNGVTHVEYVGSPLAREVHSNRTREEFCRDHSINTSEKIISLLPGSRHKEIVRILPVMMAAAVEVARHVPNAQFLIPIASGKNCVDVGNAKDQFAAVGGNPSLDFTIVENETYDALNASDAAAVTSGTATLETGIIGTPMVIVYKTSAINYGLLEPLISVEHYGLLNLIAGERLAKELIQHEFTPETLSAELLRLLDADENDSMRKRLKTATDKLGHGGASKRAAEAILKLIDADRPR